MNVVSLVNVIVNALVPLGFCVVLPVTIVFYTVRRKMNQDNMRKEIVLAALEKNAEIDIEDLVKKMNEPKKLLKEKLLRKLQIGLVTISLGLGSVIALPFIADCFGEDNESFMRVVIFFIICFSVCLLAVGIAFLVSYYVGKKMLAKEMEAEEKNLHQA